ncbi:MAG: lysophospholipid acyltransferase family protein [Roseovarius sp.]
MSFTWSEDRAPPRFVMPRGGWLRIGLRGGAIVLVLGGAVMLALLLRPAEIARHGRDRPWTRAIAARLWRACLRILRLRLEVSGAPMRRPGALVANHASWLDILVLGACERVTFVAKSDVARWPGIGALAAFAGTLFIARDPRQAGIQQRLIADELLAGRRLLFFPEGTSSDGFRVLPFKSTLFAAFFDRDLKPEAHVQPISVIYEAPAGEDPRFHGWWGEMERPRICSGFWRCRTTAACG